MRKIFTLFLLAALPMLVSAEGVTVYMDIYGDITHDESRAPRLKLKKQRGLKLGRMAGIWGAVGKGDTGDAVFLGKTPVPSRMQFTLAVSSEHAPVEMTVKARDGSNLVQHKISAQPGETVKQWLVMKGRISLKVISPTRKESIYAAYFWYPGDRLDGMSDSDFNQVNSGQVGKVKSFARRAKGGQ